VNKKEAATFLKKSSQKTFVNLGLSGSTSTGPEESKVFCALFFKKALLSLNLT
jgi:hypothetical protein